MAERLSIGRGVLGLLDRGAQRAADRVLNALQDLADDDEDNGSDTDEPSDGDEPVGRYGVDGRRGFDAARAAVGARAGAGADATADAAWPRAPSPIKRSTVPPDAAADAPHVDERVASPPPDAGGGDAPAVAHGASAGADEVSLSEASAVEAAVRRAQRALLTEWSGAQFAAETALTTEIGALEFELDLEREIRRGLSAREASWAALHDRLRIEAAQREADAARREGASADALRDEVVALRARALAQQAALRERDLMLDELASSAAQGDAVTWRARAELAQSEVAELKARARALADEHEPELARARLERADALARVRALEADLEGVRAVARGAEGQLARLSGALHLHVAEADELAGRLREAEARLANAVDRQVARSWVVNFVESAAARGGLSAQGAGARRRELLEMMAAWWDFTAEDRIRVGLVGTADALLDPRESLGERWGQFLDRESEGGGGSVWHAPPAPRLDRSTTRG
ncbi:hypothetical protein KFE25_013093 [Diacronema lutheri]|uniref:Uncharacterized protein n=1 Tax=Diacronema lutheri TaxID=2081491 RepID=A0A8J5X6H7_DIALT|nr:hypothetical protein KFE25_013093 [Diacronema lutheri]